MTWDETDGKFDLTLSLTLMPSPLLFRATVRDFKGTILLDIREYYGSGTDTKPGKKGISLKVEEVS